MKDYKILFDKRRSQGKKLLIDKYRQNPEGLIIVKDIHNNVTAAAADLVFKGSEARYFSIWEIFKTFKYYGFRIMIPNMIENYKVKENESYIDKLAVKKEYRNKGIGLILLKELLIFSKKKNKKYLSFWVAKENSLVLHLYCKFGFKKIREIRAGFFERFHGYTYFYFLKKEIEES